MEKLLLPCGGVPDRPGLLLPTLERPIGPGRCFGNSMPLVVAAAVSCILFSVDFSLASGTVEVGVFGEVLDKDGVANPFPSKWGVVGRGLGSFFDAVPTRPTPVFDFDA